MDKVSVGHPLALANFRYLANATKKNSWKVYKYRVDTGVRVTLQGMLLPMLSLF